MEQNLAYYTQHPEQLNESTLQNLRNYIHQYPYSHTARLLMLQNLFMLHDISFGEEMRKNAPLVPDRSILFELVESENNQWKNTIPVKKEEFAVLEDADRTQSLIDQYLDSAPDESLSKGNRKPTIVDATTDYATYLLQMDDAQTEESQTSQRSNSLINDFIGNNSGRIVLATPDETIEESEITLTKEPQEQVASNQSGEEEYFTETLAKIYIQQGRYEKAIEIIRKLYSNNPKKNCYFADQLRFLEKLVINNQSNQ